MPFTLEVYFSGICTYVIDPTSNKATVLMPDARCRDTGKNVHWDKDIGDPHIGYLRFNLADMITGMPRGTVDEPELEVVHRFDCETLFLDGKIASPVMMANPLDIPHLKTIATDPGNSKQSFLYLDDKLFTDSNPADLLMRAPLPGGTLTSVPDEDWVFTEVLAAGTKHSAKFASYVTWKKNITTEFVSVRLVPFDTTRPEIVLGLRPADGKTVKLKVVNFCKENPLEWGDFGKRQADKDDRDFKWNYQLFNPRKDKWEDLLGARGKLPIPHRPVGTSAAGIEDCLGAQTEQKIP